MSRSPVRLSHALGIVATGISWKSGDNCVVADGDFPANVVPWKNLRHRHEIDVRLIPFRPQMQITLDDLKPLVDERTRIVSLCSANFLSGCPINITEIGAMAARAQHFVLRRRDSNFGRD